MKIAFDFDETLNNHKHATFIRMLLLSLQDKNDVWILTSRSKENYNEDLYEIADAFNITVEKILFTNGDLKVDTFIKHGFHILFDNQHDEIQAINDSGNCGILINFDLPDILEGIEDTKRFDRKFLSNDK